MIEGDVMVEVYQHPELTQYFRSYDKAEKYARSVVDQYKTVWLSRCTVQLCQTMGEWRGYNDKWLSAN